MVEEHKKKESPILPVGHCVAGSSLRWPVLMPVNGLVLLKVAWHCPNSCPLCLGCLQSKSPKGYYISKNFPSPGFEGAWCSVLSLDFDQNSWGTDTKTDFKDLTWTILQKSFQNSHDDSFLCCRLWNVWQTEWSSNGESSCISVEFHWKLTCILRNISAQKNQGGCLCCEISRPLLMGLSFEQNPSDSPQTGAFWEVSNFHQNPYFRSVS